LQYVTSNNQAVSITNNTVSSSLNYFNTVGLQR
jgi:hypothetical protein